MLSSTTHTLEHFYYGQIVREGRAEGDMRLLARSPGVTDEMITECVKQALLPPLVNSVGGAWGLIRSKTPVVPFIMVQSALGKAAQPMLHYIILPVDVARSIAGNLRALLPLVEDELPLYDKAGGVLKVLQLTQIDAPTKDEQIDKMLNLMTYTNNKFATMEKLLAAIIQGVGIIVTNAPRDVKERTGFVEGLLELLPPSARFGVTFATHTLPSSKLDAQIRFFADAHTPPEGAMVYDWKAGEVHGKDVEDDYARFITSQLRLDAELVIQQTSALTHIASWRIRRGDKLGEALKYASHRLKVDDALRNNQPVESADVAKILEEDPTLTEELRASYANHLLSFALALGEMQPAAPIAVLLRQNPDLDKAVLARMVEAADGEKSEIIYDTLVDWLSNPLGPQSSGWVDLLHKTTLKLLNNYVKANDAASAGELLEDAVNADVALNMGVVIPQMIETALPLAGKDSALSGRLTGLAINRMDKDGLRKLFASKSFAASLPKPVGALVMVLNGDPVPKTDTQTTKPADPRATSTGEMAVQRQSVLVEAARAFGEGARRVALARFAEMALDVNRLDLFDPPALNALVKVALSPVRDQYLQTLVRVARALLPEPILTKLEQPSPRLVLGLLLACGAYRDVAQEILRQAKLFYNTDAKQSDYLAMIQRLFAETPIPVEIVPRALEELQAGGVKAVPLMMAYTGALEAHEWSPALAQVAQTATNNLAENRAVVQEVIPSSAVMALLQYHVERKDVNNAIRVAGLVPVVAARTGALNVIGRMYKLMQWDERARVAALELLRRYVRYASDSDARKAIEYFGKELGDKVRVTLEATHLVRTFMGGVDIVTYNEYVHETAQFLQDTAQAYDDQRLAPSVGGLMNDLDSLTGGLGNEDRLAIARDVVAFGEAVVLLGNHHKSAKGAREAQAVGQLLAGKIEPRSALDIFRAMGGYLSKGRRANIDLFKMPHPHPFQDRSAPKLKNDLQLGNRVLRGALRAINPKKTVGISIEALHSEIDSLWGEISLHQQRQIVNDLSTDLQRIAELTAHVADKGGREALQEDNGRGRALESGRERPKTALEFYRYVAGYFKRKAGK